MLTDSHCHLDRVDAAPFGGTVEGVIEAAKAAGVTRMLCAGIDLDHFPLLRELAERHPEVWCSVGVHPSEHPEREPTVDELVELARHPRVVAIGETGLDYHYNEGDLEWQRERFRVHIRAARETAKPVIVHMREATEDTLRTLKEEDVGEAGGVMHCFTEDRTTAARALDLGLYVSFSGIVTFRSADLIREAAAFVPDDRLLIETDSPYLAPVPFRGKPNHPALVRHVAEKLAEVRGTSFERIAGITSRNFEALFLKAVSGLAR